MFARLKNLKKEYNISHKLLLVEIKKKVDRNLQSFFMSV